MNHIVDGLHLIGQVEADLQKHVAQAASSGDYDAVFILTSMAQELANVRRRYGSPNGAGEKVTAQPPKKPRKNEYPRFYRLGDELVKVGWSRKAKKEYQHKAAHSVLRETVRRIVNVSARSKLISAEALLAQQSADGTSIPDYQIYVCLGFLKEVRLLKQKGRQGYSPSTTDILESAESAWKELPQHSGERA